MGWWKGANLTGWVHHLCSYQGSQQQRGLNAEFEQTQRQGGRGIGGLLTVCPFQPPETLQAKKPASSPPSASPILEYIGTMLGLQDPDPLITPQSQKMCTLSRATGFRVGDHGDIQTDCGQVQNQRDTMKQSTEHSIPLRPTCGLLGSSCTRC